MHEISNGRLAITIVEITGLIINQKPLPPLQVLWERVGVRA
jgi:hypothetical protein